MERYKQGNDHLHYCMSFMSIDIIDCQKALISVLCFRQMKGPSKENDIDKGPTECFMLAL